MVSVPPPPPPRVSSLSLNPAEVQGTQNSTATVTLTGAAPTGGLVVALASDHVQATVPNNVVVPQGTISAMFTVTTTAVGLQTMAHITATLNGSVMATLTVDPPINSALASVTFTPNTVVGGNPATGGLVTLTQAVAFNIGVTLSSPSNLVTFPNNPVTVLANQPSAAFTVNTSAVTVNTPVTITATLNGTGSAKSTILTLTPAPPPPVSALSFNPTAVTGTTPSQGTVTLAGTAPPGGVTVNLSSNNSAVASVPKTVQVPAGANLATFTVTTFAVGVATPVTITATAASGGMATATLTVDPASSSIVSLLFFNPPTVVGGFGVTATGTVVLSSAPSAATTVMLASSDPSVSVPPSVVVAGGATSATFTANAIAVMSQKIATITATLGGSVTNTLTVNAPATAAISEQIVLAGETTSPDFPVTPGAFQTSIGSLDTAWAGSITLTTPLSGNVTASRNFVTYLGMTGVSASSFGQARDAFIDSAGNVYVCGQTSDTSLPTTPKAGPNAVVQPNFAGAYRNAFIAKFDPTGKVLALTYLGGATGPGGTSTSETFCYNIFVDPSDFVYVSGRTSASDFPVTKGAFQTTYGGGNPIAPHFGGDFWIAKLNPNMVGPTPVWATYVGGMGDDGARGRLAVDPQGNVIVGGFGQSTADFPVPSGQTLPTLTNVSNFGAVVKISADGKTLLYTTIIWGKTNPPSNPGQTVSNASGGVLLDGAGDAYVCGFGTATDLITTSGAPLGGFQTASKGAASAYLAKISPTGQILAMTLINGSGAGGHNTEECKGLAFDSENNIIMYTPTNSADYPTTVGAFQTSLQGQNNIAVTKFTPDLSHVIFSTIVGGSGHEDTDAGRVELDGNENIWFPFFTTSTDLPAKGVVTSNALPGQTTFPAKTCGSLGFACSEVVFVKLSADGSKILFGSYLGGSGADNLRTLRYHKN